MNKWRIAFQGYVLAALIAMCLYRFYGYTTPFAIIAIVGMTVMALAGCYGRLPYGSRYLTDSIADDGSITNLREEPFPRIPVIEDEGSRYRREQAEINNRLAHQNNEGRGEHYPDE